MKGAMGLKGGFKPLDAPPGLSGGRRMNAYRKMSHWQKLLVPILLRCIRWEATSACLLPLHSGVADTEFSEMESKIASPGTDFCGEALGGLHLQSPLLLNAVARLNLFYTLPTRR